MPYTKSFTSPNPETSRYYLHREWNVSRAKDRSLPLQFFVENCTSRGGYERSGLYGMQRLWVSSQLTSSVSTACRSAAAEAVAEAPNLLLNIAEKQQTIDLFADSAHSFISHIRKLRRGDLSKIKATWNARKKVLPDSWLKIHFGVEPLVKDAYAFADLISQPCKTHYLNITKSGYEDELKVNSSARYRRHVEYSVRARGAVGIEYPNLFLASRLGLANPATIAWEMVPFSFVVDWFTTFGDVIASYTDFAGVDVSRVSHTQRTVGLFKEWIDYGPGWPSYDGPTYEQFRLVREPGPPPAALTVKPFKGLSITRGATAVALLLQSFNRV